MAYDEGLAQRVREILEVRVGVTEKRMFGGIAFMVRGAMCAGLIGDDLIARVGPTLHQELLGRAHARPFDFTGRPMRGFVVVGAEGIAEDSDLASWLDTCLAFNATLAAEAGLAALRRDAKKSTAKSRVATKAAGSGKARTRFSR